MTEDCALHIVLLKPTTDRHEASRRARLLVSYHLAFDAPVIKGTSPSLWLPMV